MPFKIKVINDPPKASLLTMPDFKISVLQTKTYTIDILDETPYSSLVYTLNSPPDLSTILTISQNVIKFAPPSTMKTTTYPSVILSVSDGINSPVNLNPFKVVVENLPPNIAGLVIDDVTVKVGQKISFLVNVTDELPYNFLDLNLQVGSFIKFVSTVHVGEIWNKVMIQPSFNEPDYIWTANLTASDL